MSNGRVTNTDIRLRSIDLSDIKDIFKWRNHDVIRKYSFNTNTISWDDHKRWFDSKCQDPDTKIYIACTAEDKIGTVRFDNKDNELKVSVMLNPDFLNKGLGSEVIKSGVEKLTSEAKLDKPIIAEIKKDNIASIKAFQKAGFEESHMTFVYNT